MAESGQHGSATAQETSGVPQQQEPQQSQPSVAPASASPPAPVPIPASAPAPVPGSGQAQQPSEQPGAPQFPPEQQQQQQQQQDAMPQEVGATATAPSGRPPHAQYAPGASFRDSTSNPFANEVENTFDEELVGEMDNIEDSVDPSVLGVELVHGEIRVLVFKARKLVDPDATCGCLPAGCCGRSCGVLPGTDPMVKVYVGSHAIAQTSIKKNTFNPDWNELFRTNVCHEAQRLTFRIVDTGKLEERALGQVSFSMAQILAEGQSSTGILGEFPLTRRRREILNLDTFSGAWSEDKKVKLKRRKTRDFGWLKIRLQFVPAEKLTERRMHAYRAKQKFASRAKMRKVVELFHPCVVPDTYFRAHCGDHFMLYQSAHQPGYGSFVPDILLDTNGHREDDQKPFRARSCWTDLYRALNEAERFICISGVVLDPSVKLVRTGPGHEDLPSIGRMLKEKSEEGVKVFIMLWHDESVHPFMRKSEYADIEQKLKKFFRHTKVVIAKVARKNEKGLKGQAKAHTNGMASITGYGHNQNSIIMDCKPSNAARLQIRHRKHKNTKIQAVTAFVGGLDLMPGRYDDTDKALFATLRRTHKNDFYQPCLPASVVVKSDGPRLPWQDAHARVSGYAAVDVLKNFIERWHKQVGWHRYTARKLVVGKWNWVYYGFKMKGLMKLLKRSPGEGALPQSFLREARDQIIGRVDTVLRLSDKDNARNNFGINRQNENDDDDDLDDLPDEDFDDLQQELDEIMAEQRARTGSWNEAFVTNSSINAEKVVQVLRSIDEDAAEMDKRITAPNVAFERDLKIDDSLHAAYIHHIRHAEHFVYIETETFIGSSHMWSESRSCGATNLIPAELVVKVCSKIQQGQPFHVYLVLPLFPAGQPSDPAIQQVLQWQYLTIQMMYRRIAHVLRTTGSEKKPIDYLSVLFLGKREAAESHKRVAVEEGLPDGNNNAMSGTGTEDFEAVYRKVLRNRRFMIYVHSKLLVVDDHVAVIGSGSVSQRAMAGTRDTELAVSMFEANHLATATTTPQGQVYGYRMSLWAEHLGPESIDTADFDPTILQRPNSDECVQFIRSRAKENWSTYTNPTEEENTCGHFITYPYDITDDGIVLPLAGFESFPDFANSPVLGDKNPVIPLPVTL